MLVADPYTPIRDGLTEIGRRVLADAREEIRLADQALESVERRTAERRASTFICPHCTHELSKVTDSRGNVQLGSVRRRRECLQCGTRFTTIERIILGTILTKSA